MAEHRKFTAVPRSGADQDFEHIGKIGESILQHRLFLFLGQISQAGTRLTKSDPLDRIHLDFSLLHCPVQHTNTDSFPHHVGHRFPPSRDGL